MKVILQKHLKKSEETLKDLKILETSFCYTYIYVLHTNWWSTWLLWGGFTSHKLHELHNYTKQNINSTTTKRCGSVAFVQCTHNHSQPFTVPTHIVVHTTRRDVGSWLVTNH